MVLKKYHVKANNDQGGREETCTCSLYLFAVVQFYLSDFFKFMLVLLVNLNKKKNTYYFDKF